MEQRGFNSRHCAAAGSGFAAPRFELSNRIVLGCFSRACFYGGVGCDERDADFAVGNSSGLD